MSKILYIARHAKSSWNDLCLSDFERPLNKRGLRDAPFMSKVLKDRVVIPDIIISSPALRAKATAQYYNDKLRTKLEFNDSIYEASPMTLLYLTQEALQEHDSIMIIGHNPGLTILNNQLSDKQISNMPTASIVGIEFGDEIAPYQGKGLFFEYPKLYFLK
ncbi:MAG: histidine phosphatase family protein [Sulfurovum sp.]|nr:histidine phosphatase family protein [Sulfurovum sp.]